MRLFQKAISPKQVLMFNKKQCARIIDVREIAEYKQASITGSKNIPLQKLVSNPKAFLKDNEEYYIICHSGLRSKRAISLLKKQGYTNLTNIKGGYITYARIQND